MTPPIILEMKELCGPESEWPGLWPAPGTTRRVLAVWRSRDLCARPPRASCPTHPLPEARRRRGRHRPAPRPSSARAETRGRKCAAPRSAAAALGAWEVRGRSALGGPRPLARSPARPGCGACGGSRVPTFQVSNVVDATATRAGWSC